MNQKITPALCIRFKIDTLIASSPISHFSRAIEGEYSSKDLAANIQNKTFPQIQLLSYIDEAQTTYISFT